MVPYEIVEHTAEIGIKAYGRSREEIFIHMAQGMFSLVVPSEEIQSPLSLSVCAQAQGWDSLLVAWLKELLYLFDTQHFLVHSVRIQELKDGSIQATVSGERLDRGRHHVDKEIKAVTYCDLDFSKRPDGLWTAQVIFDI